MKTDGSDAGPAFPTQQSAILQNQPSEGMSLRDYFAAKALVAICTFDSLQRETHVARYSIARENGRSLEQEIAKNCYAMADAMLEARK